jgi:hypothetical protein
VAHRCVEAMAQLMHQLGLAHGEIMPECGCPSKHEVHGPAS